MNKQIIVKKLKEYGDIMWNLTRKYLKLEHEIANCEEVEQSQQVGTGQKVEQIKIKKQYLQNQRDGLQLTLKEHMKKIEKLYALLFEYLKISLTHKDVCEILTKKSKLF